MQVVDALTGAIQQDEHGQLYEDFYRVVAQEEVRLDWLASLQMLRREFGEYRGHARCLPGLWDSLCGTNSSANKVPRPPHVSMTSLSAVTPLLFWVVFDCVSYVGVDRIQCLLPSCKT